MAPRIRKVRHDENTRARIQTTQLVKRLMQHVDGDVELKNSQVKAIEILLRKSLPDLTQVSGDQDNPIKTALEISWATSKG